MDLKLSISILISSAYFLTLLIFNLLKTNNILSTLTSSVTYASIIFVMVYMLLLYLDYAFERQKKKDSQDALEQIKRIEEEFKQKQRDSLDKRLKEIQEEESKQNQEELNWRDDTVFNKQVLKEAEDIKEDADELQKLKRESGTQFDSSFIRDYDIPQI